MPEIASRILVIMRVPSPIFSNYLQYFLCEVNLLVEIVQTLAACITVENVQLVWLSPSFSIILSNETTLHNNAQDNIPNIGNNASVLSYFLQPTDVGYNTIFINPNSTIHHLVWATQLKGILHLLSYCEIVWF